MASSRRNRSWSTLANGGVSGTLPRFRCSGVGELKSELSKLTIKAGTLRVESPNAPK